ncbi:DUF3298 and DUF4163 domain-containing protein [Schlesneria paludicola]|uniref:DUF3298 and DUF4163 domain-containing protein n=1 Tax=Schlesneria paludicola TaxID=360056 RepID=UPI00029B3904|nr:DUF3298 and DUF4163 domain-containing protein [Schlesneria paludicola]
MQDVLKTAGRILRLGLPFGLLVAAMLAYYSQNFTVVSRHGDFTLATSELMADQFPAHVAGEGLPSRVFDAVPHVGVASPVAKRLRLRRQAGFAYGNRGHSVSFSCDIPEFPEDSAFLKSLNQQLRREYEAAAAEFTVADWTTVYEGWKEPQSYLMNWEGSIDLDIIHASSTVVSILESRHEYTGGAHGNLVLVGRCFVESRGMVRQLQLGDLFEGGSPWARRLVDFCLNDLREQGASSVPPEPADDPEMESFSTEDLRSFTLSVDGLTFYFSPYHVGCYAEGVFTVHVPYAVIRDLIPDQSPARHFIDTQTK